MPENLARRQIKIKAITQRLYNHCRKKSFVLFYFTSKFRAKEVKKISVPNPCGFCLLKGYIGGSVSP